MPEHLSKTHSKRLPFIDWLRGMSVLLMIIYHFCYDLDLFGYIDTAFGRGYWIPFRYIIVISFLLLVGVSLVMVHHKQLNWPSVKKRSLQLFIAGVIVSGSGYFVAANKITLFGILQLILVASFFALPLIKKPILAFALGIVVFSLGHIVSVSAFDNVWLNWLGMAETVRPALDYVPVFPWFGVVLMGIPIGHWFITDKGRGLGRFTLSKHSNGLVKYSHSLIEKMGQHSLVIYLVHQPILFGTFYVLDYLN